MVSGFALEYPKDYVSVDASKVSKKYRLRNILVSKCKSILPKSYRTPPEDAPLLKALALTGQNAIQKFNGRKYHVGSIAEIAKSKTGGSIADYVYGILKVPLVLVMELPRDKLKLNPSPNFINCVCKEAWAGMQQMCNSVIIYKAKYQKKWKDTHIASKGTGFKNWSTDIDYINLICAENSTDAKSTL